MIRCFRWASFGTLVLLLPVVAAQEGKYSIKTMKAEPPKEVSEPIRKMLKGESIQLYNPAGKLVGTFWFRKEIPADATPQQIKNGLTYREVKQSEIFGVVKVEQDWSDYRKQKVKAGTYTLRLAYQPMDGDHTGSSDYQDFLLLLDAAKDTKSELMDVKHMVEVSMKSIATGHPAALMLFPPAATAPPSLAALPKDHWVLQTKADVAVGGKSSGAIGISLTVAGHASN